VTHGSWESESITIMSLLIISYWMKNETLKKHLKISVKKLEKRMIKERKIAHVAQFQMAHMWLSRT
jgi:hypothetical protein